MAATRLYAGLRKFNSKAETHSGPIGDDAFGDFGLDFVLNWHSNRFAKGLPRMDSTGHSAGDCGMA